jgi:hypothetical protein
MPGVGGPESHPTQERAMPNRNRLLALTASALLLAGCGKENIDPPLPAMATPATAGISTTPQSASPGSDTSVPSATSVFAADPSASTAANASIVTNSTMTNTQESNAMPMAGQAGSHSAPKATDKSASSP